MKKRISKWRNRKDILRVCKNGCGRAAAFTIAAILLFGTAFPTYGREPVDTAEREAARHVGDAAEREAHWEREETAALGGSVKAAGGAPKVVYADIFHRHIGSPDVQGGCYSIKIDHVHQGDESIGGPCYKTEVKHVHQGSADAEGGCYSVPIQHTHEGDAVNGGGCYGQELTHTHSNEDGCYQAEECYVEYDVGDVFETFPETCTNPAHQQHLFNRSNGIADHHDCGQGKVALQLEFCAECGFFAPTFHDYDKVICGIDEGSVIGYGLNCGKDEDTIEYYETGCGKTEGEVESFQLSCDKDADGYLLGCGLSEDVPCGRLVVTNETAGTGEQAALSVKLEDLSGGKLRPGADPFSWTDEKGNGIGSGAQIEVSENGNYSVTLKLENKDVDESGLTARILVDNIEKASPVATATPSGDPSPEGTPLPSATPNPSPFPSDGPFPSSEPSATSSPEDTPAPGDDNGDSTGGEDEETGQGKKEDGGKKGKEGEEDAGTGQTAGVGVRGKKKMASDLGISTPTPFPTPPKPVMKESVKVPLQENEGANEVAYKVGGKSRWSGIFADPAVRIVTVSTGILVLLAGLFLLLLYLRHSVRIYNDDGEGRMIYLGRCLVELEEDIYTITIKDAMVEKAYTNRYCIKPGIFRIGKGKEQELVVRKEEKSATVYLEKEIIVML